ncbi:MAG: hypothetical protein H6907_18825 [Hyphomicrobiales bacterium]|nr:hypothetical protein [Hyphomicrobiales bacterium]MCP5373789.1 hypothetical protein [Hyphomicrobiales bacterium]
MEHPFDTAVRVIKSMVLAAFLGAAATVPAAAQTAAPAAGDAKEEPIPDSVTHQMYLDMKLGKLNIHGDNAVVEALVLQRDIPITYEYIATLMRTPNAFGDGPACIVCHGSNNPAKSYRGMDLSTCEGMLRGATEKPARHVITPGEPEKSLLVKMLRNNRMPLGVQFFEPVNSESIELVFNWIQSGAKNDEQFQNEVLPLFAAEEAFGSDTPCIDCHKSHRDPPSFNEVNLKTFEGIMMGAFSKTRGKDGLPGVPIVVPYDAANSPLYQRLTMNRMPPGVDPGADPNHPNTLLLMRWIEQGAWCK